MTPDNVIAMNNLAWIMCEEQHRFEEALELVETGLKLQPTYADLIDTRGVTYYRMGEYEKAIKDFNLSIRLYPKDVPENVSTNFHLVRALVKNGQDTQAFQMIDHVLEQGEKVGGLAQKDIDELINLRNSISPD